MARTTYDELLDAGVHFGHLTRKWDPKMSQYIFMERNGIHIIDLNKTLTKVEEAAAAIKQIVKSGRKVLFVATKKQAKDIVADYAKSVNMPYITERWLGGMLTNFATVRKSIKKMSNIDKLTKDGTYSNLSKKERLMIQRERIKLETLLGGMLTNFATVRKSIKKMSNIDKLTKDGTYANLSKKERLMIQRERIKLETLLGGIADLNRLPAALFLIDVKKEHIAVSEALKLNIPTFAMVDTNSDPSNIDFPIPANDDATKSISLITGIIIQAIIEGLEERKREKEDEAEKEAAVAKAKADAPEAAAPVADRAPAAEGKRTRKVAVEAEAAVEDATPTAEKEEE